MNGSMDGWIGWRCERYSDAMQCRDDDDDDGNARCEIRDEMQVC